MNHMTALPTYQKYSEYTLHDVLPELKTYDQALAAACFLACTLNAMALVAGTCATAEHLNL